MSYKNNVARLRKVFPRFVSLLDRKTFTHVIVYIFADMSNYSFNLSSLNIAGSGENNLLNSKMCNTMPPLFTSLLRIRTGVENAWFNKLATHFFQLNKLLSTNASK